MQDPQNAGLLLDGKDRALLEALRGNARESLVALARRVGLSRSSTQDRLRRLERSGIIAGYTVRLRDLSTVPTRAVLMVAFAPGASCSSVVPGLRAIPEITACDSLAGNPDLLLSLACSSNTALEAVRARVAAVPGVAAVSTHVVLEQHWSSAPGQAGPVVAAAS